MKSIVRPFRLERVMGEDGLVQGGRAKVEGIVELLRWEARPSSTGTGRSEGKVV